MQYRVVVLCVDEMNGNKKKNICGGLGRGLLRRLMIIYSALVLCGGVHLVVSLKPP